MHDETPECIVEALLNHMYLPDDDANMQAAQYAAADVWKALLAEGTIESLDRRNRMLYRHHDVRARERVLVLPLVSSRARSENDT